jgi:guanylate kinase
MTADGPKIERRGLLLVLSSPSGAGKTTLARRLIEADRGISMSVSVTTRAPRPGEVDGYDYRFIDEASFKRMREEGELLEWARVFDNFYGTPRAPVEAAVAKGHDILFDIDWQGAQQLSETMKHDVMASSSYRLGEALGAPHARAGPARWSRRAGGVGRDQPLAEYDCWSSRRLRSLRKGAIL